MRRRSLILFSFLTACSARTVDSDCDSMCQLAGPDYPGVGECKEGVCTPTYAECSAMGDVSTCAEACEAQGSSCVANGCGGYTYRIFYDMMFCEAPTAIGVEIERECDEPIDWQLNEAVKCCCEQEY
ncbi:hypothetical protein [Enhygromyxa salina]|nr:hypothetical protein [Enhygromyxa salina]